jgi:hypothetical protein
VPPCCQTGESRQGKRRHQAKKPVGPARLKVCEVVGPAKSVWHPFLPRAGGMTPVWDVGELPIGGKDLKLGWVLLMGGMGRPGTA